VAAFIADTCEWTLCLLVFFCVSFQRTEAGSLPNGGSFAFSVSMLSARWIDSCPWLMVDTSAR
jgi:hypothetical protein